MLQPGRRQVAAGYVIYGSSTMMVYTTGQGVHGFTLDPSIGEFLLSHPNIRIPDKGRYLRSTIRTSSCGASGVRSVMRKYKGLDGDHKALSTRYVGSLVADFHRNLLGGGIFAYPANKKNSEWQAAAAVRGESAGVHRRAGRGRGVRRQCSESSTCTPTELHQRTPLYIGSKNEVELATQNPERHAGAGRRVGARATLDHTVMTDRSPSHRPVR